MNQQPTYTIVTDPAMPTHGPHMGWRRLFAWLPFRKPRAFMQLPNGTLICHPDSLQSLGRYLESKNIKYQVQRKLEVVK